jgi:carbon-monoxide dehydrogenase medium subunit
MIRTQLHYHRPVSPAAASALLAEYAGDVVVLGGGTQLLPLMNRDQIHVAHVVDLRGLELDRIVISDEGVDIGAMVTYGDVLNSPEVKRASPLLPRAARDVTGGRQIVDQATIVGAACFNFPGSDMPGVLRALDAKMRVHGPGGQREAAARDFFVGAFKVDLCPGEFVTSVLVSRAADVGYCKVKHSAGSWPIATASAVRHPRTGAIVVTLGAVAAVPVQIELDGADRLNDQVREAVATPWSDELAPGSYRASIAAVVARRALAELQENAS